MSQIIKNSIIVTEERALTLAAQLVGGQPYGMMRASQNEFSAAAYYSAVGDVVSSTGTPSVGDLQFTPFWSGAGGIVSELAFNVNTVGGAGSVARCGLYNADQDLLIPTTLVVDGGQFATDSGTGIKNTTGLSLVLAPATLYYFAWICGTAAPVMVTLSSGAHFFGRNANFNAQFGLIKTGFGYAALPLNAPNPVTGYLSSAAVMVVARFSAYTK